jgi:hypothetical protein
MEDYYNKLLRHLDSYTVMGLFEGKRDIKDIVTLQTGDKGRVFFFDQEPMIKDIDTELWDYIFQEPTIFANSELDSADKEYVKSRYPNFVDWYYFSHGLVSREWFSAQRYNYAGWVDQKTTVLDCNLLQGRQQRLYLIYMMYRKNFANNSYISFRGSYDWLSDLKKWDQFGLLEKDDLYDRIPNLDISYDNWGEDLKEYNGLMQSRIPLEYYSKSNYILISETLYVENKKHLTEKIFKPIVAGKPFILVSGYQNLQYLKRYGFQTFGNLWSEVYDQIEDPKIRLDSIINTMMELSLLYSDGVENKEALDLFNQAHEIAYENRKYFWSDKFYQTVMREALDNLEFAKAELSSKCI